MKPILSSLLIIVSLLFLGCESSKNEAIPVIPNTFPQAINVEPVKPESDLQPGAAPDQGQDPAGKEDTIHAHPSITVAIIDFESQVPGNPELGHQLADILTARMSIYDQFQLVERGKLDELLKEQQLNLTEMIDTKQAIQVGKMLGAKIMIFGRAFSVDKELNMVAKIVGTETGQVKGVIVQGKLDSNLSDIIDQLVDQLVIGLDKWASSLLPQNEIFPDKIGMMKEQLAGKKLPVVAVIVQETHIHQPIGDPAAETEMKKIFKQVGFTVIETKHNNLEPSPQDIVGVDIVITGKGFSEYGTRIGGLVSCAARLEVQVMDRNSKQVIASERTTRRAVDLSDGIAGKTALQAAAHELAIKAIESIADTLIKNQEVQTPLNN
jgi:TolB-like protein